MGEGDREEMISFIDINLTESNSNWNFLIGFGLENLLTNEKDKRHLSYSVIILLFDWNVWEELLKIPNRMSVEYWSKDFNLFCNIFI